MIPKIIHYSWFSGEDIPKEYAQMMATWKQHLPDYEFKLWDAAALKNADILFANEAYSVKKWAFAADAIRTYAVYHDGGIWLDGDVTMHKSFDSFLGNRMFIGKEYSEEFQLDGQCTYVNRLTAHCFGAEKGHPFLKDCVDYYKNRHFILSYNENLPQGLRYDMRLLPSILALLATKYGYKGRLLNTDQEECLKADIHIFPPYYFDAPRYHGMDDVVCVHNCLHSWTPQYEKTFLQTMVGKPRKKNISYYLFALVNKILKKRGLRIKLLSV